MTLYKFALDEYDKGRKIVATSMALLITWVHASLRGQLEAFDDPKDAYDHLIARYSVTDARAREMAETQFNGIYASRFGTVQDYINAIENSAQDIKEAGGYCDDPMLISKIIRGLKGHPTFKDFATQYHLLRDIDPKFEDLDHVITQLLTFESTNQPEPDYRIATANGNQSATRANFVPREQRLQRDKCTACGIWGHKEPNCRKTHPEQRPQNNGYARDGSRPNYGNGNTSSGNNFRRNTKPNGMVATSIVDDKAFVNALHRARANSADSMPSLEGTTFPTLTARTLAKELPQASSSRKFGGKGEQGEDGVLCSRGIGVKESLLKEIVAYGPPSPDVTENSSYHSSRNNMSLGTQIYSYANAPKTFREIFESNASDSKGTPGSRDTTDDEEPPQPKLQVGHSKRKAKLAPRHDEDCKCSPKLPDYHCCRQNLDWGTLADLDYWTERNNVCFAASSVPVDPNSWILDSGANVYVCNNADWFKTLHMFDAEVSTAGQGSAMHIAGGGVVDLEICDGDGDPFKLTLNDVAYAPTSRCNLISVSKLAMAGIHGSWKADNHVIQLLTDNGYIIGNAPLKGGLYHLQLKTTLSQKVRLPEVPFSANVNFNDPVWKEHRRLGHLGLQRMIDLCGHSVNMNVTKGQIQTKLGQICPICATTKSIVRIPRDPARVRYETKGELVHVDIWGPYSIIGWDGSRYMLFATDDATRATKTLRLKKRSDFPELLRDLHKKEEKRYAITIRRYRADNEFNMGPWKDWCDKKGITIEPIAPRTHHQVGVAERVNRTLREGASAMIHDSTVGGQIRVIIEENGNELLRNSTLPEALWPEAIDYSAWLKTRTPTRANKSGKTPWELEEGRVPDLSREKTWGSRVYVSYTEEERGRKLHDPRGWLGYFVGCENESTYRVWDPSSLKVRRVVYTIVDEGQGLDDAQAGGNVDQGPQEPPTRPLSDSEESGDDWSEPGDDDIPNPEPARRHGLGQETVSRFFTNPTALVTERSKPRTNREPDLDDDEEGDISGLRNDEPMAFDDDDDDTGEPVISPYFATGREQGMQKENAPVGDNGEFGEFQSSMIEEDNSFHSLEPEPEPDALSMSQAETWQDQPPLPTRRSNRRTAHELPDPTDSETGIETDNTMHCSNDLCSTSKSPVLPGNFGPGGGRLCKNCYRRYQRWDPAKGGDPNRWKVSRMQNDGRQCSNELCETPKAPVRINNVGPNGLLCANCIRRYKHWNNTRDADPDNWKIAQTRRKNASKSQTLESSNESSEGEDSSRMKSTTEKENRGGRLANRVHDRDKCQRCFDRALNCKKDDDKPCSQCLWAKETCKPVQLNDDGTLPEKRHFSKTNVQDDNSWGNRCWTCHERHRQCDATLPIDPKNPCTSCRKLKSHCCSVEQHQLIMDTTPCLRCRALNKGKLCNRQEPCDSCKDASHSKCTYETDDGARWHTTLVNPISIQERSSVRDPNADYYDPEGRQGCRRCQNKWDTQQFKDDCTFVPGGPPCKRCFDSKDPSANRCTNWTAPGKCEAVATRMYKMDDVTGSIVRDTEKADNKLGKREATERKNERARVQLSDSNSEEDFEDASARINTEESRMATRRKLENVRLPEAFMAALTLSALQNPVNNALRPDPQSYSEAMKSPDSRKWAEAIQLEYNSLMENGTWKVVNLPPGRKALTTKWVLKKKLGPDGDILKYKARMVARGFQQVEGYDYTETYSGVVKAAAYRLLFALVTLSNWTCHQMDVVTAFLNGEVLEEIYIHPPQGYAHPGKVLRLLKALYGLKQSPRLWYRKLRQWLLENDWEVSKYDECVFYNKTRQLIMTVYVDDINIFGPSDEHIVPFKQTMARAFKMTDAGRASWYLGMQLKWLPDGLHIHQDGFIQQALGRYGLLGSKPANIPLDPLKKLVVETQSTADAKFKSAYMSMVGSLNYVQSKTLWSLAFPVSLASRFMTNPNQSHMDAAVQQFRYLVGNAEKGLFFQKSGNASIKGWVDSDWGGDTDTGKSTTGWVFALAGCPISWCSQRQKTVSSSSTEAEYIAASDACKEAIWLKGFYNEIGPMMNRQHQDGIPLAIDNASALKLTRNPEFHGRTKHINIRHHFIRECVGQGDIIPEWVAGKENPADLFTKALARPLFMENVARLGGGKPASDTSGASNTHNAVIQGDA